MSNKKILDEDANMMQVFLNFLKKAGLLIGFVLVTIIGGAVLDLKGSTIFTILVTPIAAILLKILYNKAAVATSKIKKYSLYFLVGYCGLALLGMWAGIITGKDMFNKDDTAKQTSNQVTVQQATPKMTDEQHNEMGIAYNAMLSEQYPGLYEACNFTKDGQALMIEVSSKWFMLHDEDKKAFMKKTATLYTGMLGARSIKINMDNFEVLIKHHGSGEKLATWDSVRGPKIIKSK